MNKKVLIIIASTFTIFIVGGLVYYLRSKNIESLIPVNTDIQKQEKKKEVMPSGVQKIEVPEDPNATKAFYRQIDSYYSATDTKLIQESAYRDQVLPNDLTSTWTPEYMAQQEKLQAQRQTKKSSTPFTVSNPKK